MSKKNLLGGLIDVAEHANLAHIALDEVLEFEAAIESVATRVSRSETLILVTADHSHTLSIPGYMKRNRSIFG
jgi:alkaline phosphatase